MKEAPQCSPGTKQRNQYLDPSGQVPTLLKVSQLSSFPVIFVKLSSLHESHIELNILNYALLEASYENLSVFKWKADYPIDENKKP